jgi:hypothetical protein
MIAGIAETPNKQIFYESCTKWCLGVSLLYTDAVFNETVRDMALTNMSLDTCALRLQDSIQQIYTGIVGRRCLA